MDDVEDINISIEDLASNTLYEKSVFYRRFIEIKGRAEAHIPQGDEENSYYYPDFPDLIIRYLAFAPLWTAILLEPICAINRATNCYVELWFRILKREVLKNKTRPLRVTEFVQRLRSSLIGRVLDKQLKLDRERDSEEVYVAPEKAQEKWNKRKKGSKKKRTYFDKPSELPKAKKETKKKSKEKKKNSKHLKRPEKTIEVESSSEGENKNDANTKVRKRKLGKEMPRKKRCIRKDIITLSSEEIDQELDNEKGKPTKAKATKGVKNNAPQQKQKKTESKRKQRNIWEKRVMSRFKHNNLKKMAVPFGGEYRRKELINTCTIDVGLSVMTYLSTNKAVKAMINNIKQEDPNYQWLEKCIEEVSAQNYSSAKYSWVTKVLKLAQTRAGGYNVYGSEVDRFVQHICGHQEYLYQTICSMDSCPKMSKTITKRDIVFQVPDHVHNDAFLQACAREWMSHFTTKCDQTYNVSGNDSTLDDDENVKWQEYFNADGTSAGFRRIAHCSGERTHLKSFKKDPPPMLVIDCTNLDNFLMDTDFEEVFEIDFMRFEVIAVTIMRNNHNTAHFRLPNGWVKYDGMASRSIQTEEGFNCQGLQHIYCVQIPSK